MYKRDRKTDYVFHSRHVALLSLYKAEQGNLRENSGIVASEPRTLDQDVSATIPEPDQGGFRSICSNRSRIRRS